MRFLDWYTVSCYNSIMVLKGIIKKIRYYNADNGYAVVLVESKRKIYTCVGVLPPISEETEIELGGEMGMSKYGEQFNIHSARIILPTSNEGIVRYLSCKLFKGIGRVTAEAIVAEFGQDTFDVIRDTPQKLTNVNGLSINKAMKLNQSFNALIDMQDAIVYLQGLDISLNLGLKIFEMYGKATRETVLNNPYKLVEDIDGVGFYTADKIAQNIGIPRDSTFRINAGLQYTLKNDANNNGHSYLPKNELIKNTAKLLALPIEEYEDKLSEVIGDLEIVGKVVILERAGEIRVMNAKYYAGEKNIAMRLIRLLKDAKNIEIDIERDMSEFERLNNIELHENQKAAVRAAVKSGVNVITGGPGTGKTTIIKCVIAIFKGLGLKVELCAPTGRAGKRLQESTGENAQTIHRLLNLSMGSGHFYYNDDNKLPSDVIIVDEVSMCDEMIFNALIVAIARGARLIMVGDKDQLPSVGIGNVLSDIIMSDTVPVSYLTHIYRQSEESLIIENAHRINKGIMPVLRNKNSDFLFDKTENSEETLERVVSLVTARIPTHMGIAPTDIQVLCPLKRGAAGVNNINIELQRIINPPTTTKGEMVKGDNVYREGDKVIHTRNQYDMTWERDGEVGSGVFNGDMGTIMYADSDGLAVLFEDGRIAEYERADVNDLQLAYAISVHKSQGSEFDVAVIALSGGAPTILTRNLLYTAVTRAKKTSVLVGSMKTLSMMVNNNYTAKRYTMLSEFLQAEHKRSVYGSGVGDE